MDFLGFYLKTALKLFLQNKKRTIPTASGKTRRGFKGNFTAEKNNFPKTRFPRAYASTLWESFLFNIQGLDYELMGERAEGMGKGQTLAVDDGIKLRFEW